MGGFYVNFTKRGPSQKQIVGYLKYTGRVAYVSPTSNGMTMVFDEECDSQDATTIEKFAEDVSKAFTTSVLAALGHDNDVLIYWLFDKGQLLDDYHSHPGYGTGEPRKPEGGDATVLCAAFGVAGQITNVRDVLHVRNFDSAAEARHRSLAQLLGIPSQYVNVGFQSIVATRLWDEDKSLLHVG